MRTFLHRLKPDLVVALILLALPLVLFGPVVMGDRTLLPADNLFAVEPFASAAGQFGANPVPHNRLLDDLVLENYPWKKFILESLRAGQIPLWNPYLFAGVPFLAAGQHSALYPFSLIFYLIPLPRAYGVFTVSQFFLAGLFTYLYLRVVGLRRLGATFGAIVYELSLFMVVSVVFPMIIAGAVWLPLILTSIERITQPGQHPALGGRPATLPWLAAGAAALGVQILAGHVEITYYTLLVSGAYSLWRLVNSYREARHGPEEKDLNTQQNCAVKISDLRRAGALLALVALGLALGAIQLVPLFELVRNNFRSGSATFEQILGWAYPWRHGLTFLVPNFYGNPSHHAYFDLFTWQWTSVWPTRTNALGQPITTIDWGIKNYVEGGTYFGLLPLLLIPIVAVVWLKSRFAPSELRTPRPTLFLVPFFFLLAFFSLAFAFPTRLYALIFWLPGINQLHSPFRWVWPLTFSAAVLSAYGIEYLQRSRSDFKYTTEPQRAQRRETFKISARFASASLWFRFLHILNLWSPFSLITFFAGVAVWGGSLILIGLIVARIGYEPLRLAGLMDRLVAELALANQAFADGRMFFSYEARWIFLFALLLIASGIVLRVSRCPIFFRKRPLWEYLALGVISLDLLVAGYNFNPAADPSILTYNPPSVEFLREDTSLWRFTTYDLHGRKPFNANLGWYFNFHDVRGYDSIFPMQYRRYMELIQPQHELDFNRIAPISQAEALNSPLLDLLNVKYVITQETIDTLTRKYTLVYDREVKIYRNETALPRAFTLPLSATLATDDFGTAVQVFDPRSYVIVAPTAEVRASGPIPATAAPVMVVDYTPNQVILTAAISEDSWLVLADSYFPGWKAFIRPEGASDEEEQEIPITLVNGNFRGVQLPAGAWTVRFKYSPDSVKLGGIISFIAGVTLLFGLGVWAWRSFYRESAAEGSTARRVAKNSLAPMALNLMNRGMDLIFAAFYLRVLGPGDVGKYTFAIVVFGWFEIITNYGLNTLLTRDLSRNRDDTRLVNRYLLSTTILRLLIGLVVLPGLVLVLGLRQALPNPLTADTLLAIALLVLGQAPATISTGLTALFYVYEKAELPAAVATVSTILKVTLGTAALILGFGFVGLAGVSIIVNLITLTLLAVMVWRLFLSPREDLRPAPRWELDWGLQRSAVRESFPLMLNHLLATLFFKVDVPMLEAIRNQQEAGRGNREVGWYNTAYKFIDAYNIIPAFFTVALFPVMSRQAAEDREALKRTYALAVKLLVGVALPLAIVTTFIAPILVGALGGQSYLPFGAIALSIIVWSIPFGWINSVTNYLLIALNRQRGLTRAFAAALLFNIAANLILIPRYGYVAAAAVTIASEIFEGLAFYWYLRRSLGSVTWAAWLWRLWLCAALMLAMTIILWPVQPLLALMLGLAGYTIAVIGLGAFDAEERAVLLQILPRPIRERLYRLSVS